MARAFDARTFLEEKQLLLSMSRRATAGEGVGLYFLDASSGELGREFRRASNEVRESREIATAAVAAKGILLQHFSEALRGDSEVVRAAVRESGRALEFASAALRNDKEIVLQAVRGIGLALQYASESLRRDEEVVREAMKTQAFALSFADASLRGNREFLLDCLSLDPFALEHACPDLRCDQDFILLAIRRSRHKMKGKPCYQKAHPKLRSLMSWEEMAAASNSSLAVRGQQAPILSVSCASTTKEGGNGCGCNMFQASMLSGTTFAVQLPLQAFADRQRPEPILEDLAKCLVGELPNHSQVAEHIFIVFEGKHAEGEDVPVTAWDWQRPLSEFIADPASQHTLDS